MPFTKIGRDDYVSPRGNHFNKAQVQLYHARGGTFDKPREDDDPDPKTRKRKQLAKMLMERK